MKISSAFPTKYLKAADLLGKNITVVISHVDMEDVGSDDHKPVVYFQGKDKGVVLNKTNATNIAMAYGDDTESWRGCEIILFPAWVDFQGKSVEAIRCRAPQPKDRSQPVAQQSPQRPIEESNGGSVTGHVDEDVPF